MSINKTLDSGSSGSHTNHFFHKSPRFGRKKRSVSRRDFKERHTDCKSEPNLSEHKKPLRRTHCSEGFNPKNFSHAFPSQSSGVKAVSGEDFELKRRSTYPSISPKTATNDRLSRSCDSLDMCCKPPSEAPSRKTLVSNETAESLCKPESRRSSTSTVRERNNSADSEFSLISIVDLAEISQESSEDITPKSKWKPQHSRSRSDFALVSSHSETPRNNDVFSLPNSLSSSATLPRIKSIFEGKQVVVQTECFFPHPQQGQSLTSFLSSNDFNISAELDRENAHFCISEALISAIEHMKCTRRMKSVEEEEEDDSDEEIRRLRQRIRIRKRERQSEKSIKTIKNTQKLLLSDGKTDTATSLSTSPPASSYSSDFDVNSIGSEDEVEDLELSGHNESNLTLLKEDGLSLSMASLFADVDLKSRSHLNDTDSRALDSDSNNLSAESVALSLLRKFSEKHLPKASELQWIVTEKEVNQRLLPLPNSWPVSPDAVEEEFNSGKTRLRGNFEWAPPRPQIIFSILPKLKQKDILEKQKYKCAGCGMKIERNFVSKFRYCNYFGKFFCQCCHGNTLAYIPGRVLWKWDFSKCYVSRFAWELLDQMYSDPLFNVQDLNPDLYRRIRQLDFCRFSRMQLFYLKDFINNCRYAEGIQDMLSREVRYIIYKPHDYSLLDFVQVKSGEMLKHLRQLISVCIDHIKQCILCQAKGFICEICRRDREIIFPFQLDRVVSCQVCGSCYHKNCFKNEKCRRCARIAERKKRLETCEEEIC